MLLVHYGQYNIIPKPKQMIYGAGELKGGDWCIFELWIMALSRKCHSLKDALEKEISQWMRRLPINLPGLGFL